MFILYAKKNQLTVRQGEPVTSGSVNVYRARFLFSPDWEGMTRKAVFIGSGTEKVMLLDDAGECDIPWETVTKHGGRLYAGVYGTTDDSALPTIKADLGEILEGVTDGGELSRPPTPDPWQQELAAKGDRLDYTGQDELGLYSGNKLLSSVPVASGGDGGTGGNGGVTDHRLLTNRDADEQHPIGAISGLQEALAEIPRPMTADELRKILMGG